MTSQQLPLQDVIEIHQLLANYGHVVDSGDIDRLGEIFTEDGAFDIRAFDQGVHRGLAAIRTVFALGAPPHPPAHHATNYFAYIDDDGVTRAKCKWLTIDRSAGRVRSGDYDDELARTPDGWRIRERVVVVRFYIGDTVQIPLPGQA